jgi:hypothetical protein
MYVSYVCMQEYRAIALSCGQDGEVLVMCVLPLGNVSETLKKMAEEGGEKGSVWTGSQGTQVFVLVSQCTDSELLENLLTAYELLAHACEVPLCVWCLRLSTLVKKDDTHKFMITKMNKEKESAHAKAYNHVVYLEVSLATRLHMQTHAYSERYR